jgi:hypothetical protein
MSASTTISREAKKARAGLQKPTAVTAFSAERTSG